MIRAIKKTAVRQILLASVPLLLCCMPSQAAPSRSELKSWKSACDSTNDAAGPLVWQIAETKFAAFAEKYPQSDFLNDAIINRGRAMYEQGKYDAAIALLAPGSNPTNSSADQFDFWIGQSYAQKHEYEMAAKIFAQLARDNPDSPLKPQAMVLEAQSHSRLGAWPRVIEELGEKDGAFQRLASTEPANPLVVRGFLLLGRAQMAQNNPAAAARTLSGIAGNHLDSALESERLSLLCDAQLASGHADQALLNVTNLIAISAPFPELAAQSQIMRAKILENLQQLPEAVSVYLNLLTNSVSAEIHRYALLKVIDLMLGQNRIDAATKILSEYTNGGDVEQLAKGELFLRQYYQNPGTAKANGSTSALETAQAQFARLVVEFTNSPYLGQAEFNLAWCKLASGSPDESLAAFGNAVRHLPNSAQQAVARFKMADLLLERNDCAGAVSNYAILLNSYNNIPVVRQELFQRALYQTVLSALKMHDLPTADAAMRKIQDSYPNSELGASSLLMVAQAQTPAQARDYLSMITTNYPDWPLLPEVQLALARTYEKEGDWTNALAHYENWIAAYSNSPALPRAEFARALASSKSGDESNAFILFTNFVVRFQTNEIARTNDLLARAKFWVGDTFFNHEDFEKAELNYQEVFRQWPSSTLAFEAQLMAGKAAFGGQRPQAAIGYFTNLTANTNCPPKLAAQATFALGDAYFGTPKAVNPDNYKDAITVFRYVATTYTNDSIAQAAWGRLGACYYAIAPDASQTTNLQESLDRQLSAYTNAEAAFKAAMNFPPKDKQTALTANKAEYWLGQTQAAVSLLPLDATTKSEYARSALDHFLNVMHGNNLPENAPPDLKTLIDAGMEAAKLSEHLGDYGQAIQLYKRLKKTFPAMQSQLDKKITDDESNLSKKAK